MSIFVGLERTESILTGTEAEMNPAENATTHLTLRATRLNSFVSTAEVESLQQNLMFASLRLRARVRGTTGAVAGMFTYFDDNNESDIEILTRDPNTEVRCTNQPSVDSSGRVVKAAEKDVNFLGKNWGQWNTYRIDWTPTTSAWYLNGANVANNTYSIPRVPSTLIMNMWSDGGVWSGVMPVGGSSYLDIEWVEMAFNTSGPATGPSSRLRRADTSEAAMPLEKRTKYASQGKCAVVCAVDNVSQIGLPTPIIVG
jgi:beta-glucanase (GH16 family)